MKVLITGGTGFVGHHVVCRFLNAGHCVRVLARRTSDTGWIESLGGEVVYGDLAMEETLTPAVAGVDVLVSLAATMGGPAREFEVATVGGTRSLFEAAKQAGVRRIVHASSIAVLALRPAPGQSEIAEDGLFESDPRLQTSYVRAKQQSERMALTYESQDGMRVVVLRPGLVFGPGGTWKLPRMGYPAGRSFLIIGNGRNLLPVTYVANLADAVLLAATRADVPGGVFNIIEDERFTQNEFLERYTRDVNPRLRVRRVPAFVFLAVSVCARLAHRLTRFPNPFQLGHILGSCRQLTYSTRRAREELAWQPRAGKETALAETMRYFAERARVSHRADVAAFGRVPVGVKPIRVAVIGCGVIAEMHTRFLSRIPGVQTVACCDRNGDAAGKLAAARSIPGVFTSVEKMLTEVRPDAVHILTPPQHNLELALLAIRHGCHVVVEKPVAVDTGQAEKMFRAAAAKGIRLCVDHNHLYDQVMIKARRLLESGALGRIVWVDSYYGFDLGSNRGNRLMQANGGRNWTFRLPGGLFQNLLPHPLAVALDVLGEPSAVRAHARYFRVVPHQPADELRIFLETAGAGGLVTVSLAASPKFHTLTVYGTKGTLLVDFAHKLLVPNIHRPHIPKSASRLVLNVGWGLGLVRGTLRMAWKVARRRWVHFDGMAALLSEFYAGILDERPVPVSSEETLRLMRVMDAAWQQVGHQNVWTGGNDEEEKQ